jgi:hypothetical protein
MELPENKPIKLGNTIFEVIKPSRLREGMVLKSGNLYARLGPKASTLEEQIHTVSLRDRGFPAPEVIDSGPYGEDWWYFTEKSVGENTFHSIFSDEFQAHDEVSELSYSKYLKVIEQYLQAQVAEVSRSNISPHEFVADVIPSNRVLPNYTFFGFDFSPYEQAIKLATERLADAPMGILQYDLNPFNVLEEGVIDFELVGYGPIGYDVLMSTRWAGTWFTNYPSRYPMAYSLSNNQIQKCDELVKGIVTSAGLEDPTHYLEEFLLLKSAWAVSDFDSPEPDWPQDKIAFRHFRAKLLDKAVTEYLDGQSISYLNYSSIKID